MNFFAEIAATNAAYCHAHGLTAAELYGTPINEAELETHRNIAAGVPAEAASFHPRKAKHMKFWPRTGVQELGYIEEHLRQCGCTPRQHPECHQAKGAQE